MALGVDEVVQLVLALVAVAGHPHDVLAVVGGEVGVFVDQGRPHALGVVDVFAEDDGLVVAAGPLQELAHLPGDKLGALLQHELAVEVGLVVDAVLDQLTVRIPLAFLGPPAGHVLVEVDPHHLVGRQEPVVDPLSQGIGVDRLAEVVDVGDVLGFAGRCGHAQVRRRREVLQDVVPLGVLRGAPAVALVHDHEIEEVRRELPVDVQLLFGAGDRLIERQVDLVRLVDLAVGDLGHGGAEGLEVVDAGLVDQDVAVGEEQDSLLDAGLPEPPDDLKGGVGLPGARRHDEQQPRLSLRHGFDHAVDGDALVVARRLAQHVGVVGLGDDLLLRLAEAFPGAVPRPQLVGRREVVKRQFLFDGRCGSGAVVEQEGVAIGAEGERHVEGFGVVQRLRHPVAELVVVVLRFEDGKGQVGLVVEHVVGASPLPTHGEPPAHNDPTVGEYLLAEMPRLPPPGLADCRREVLRADVAFAQCLLVECHHGRLPCLVQAEALPPSSRPVARAGNCTRPVALRAAPPGTRR